MTQLMCFPGMFMLTLVRFLSTSVVPSRSSSLLSSLPALTLLILLHPRPSAVFLVVMLMLMLMLMPTSVMKRSALLVIGSLPLLTVRSSPGSTNGLAVVVASIIDRTTCAEIGCSTGDCGSQNGASSNEVLHDCELCEERLS